MGKNNRQRRAHKHQGRRKGGPGRDGGPSTTSSQAGHPDIRMVVAYAACSAEHGTEEEFDGDIAKILALGRLDGRAGPAMVSGLIAGLGAAWENGWQPVDILREVGRRFDAPTVAIARWAIAKESHTTASPGTAMPEAWSAQLDQLRGNGRPSLTPMWTSYPDVVCGVRILGMLHHLPRLACLVPPPSQWGKDVGGRPRTPPAGVAPGVDSKILAKVRALLAKAESTTFEEEAESLTVKAQELMARYSIDQAMLAGASAEETPGGRRLGIDSPYADPKSLLLAEVAEANRCSAVWQDEFAFSTVFGFAADLDIVEVLYTSLLVQATRAMTRAGSVRDQFGRSCTRAYRHSFLVSFAVRIGQRLREAASKATEEASSVHGEALLPVLAGRKAEVDGAVTAAFPETVTKTSRATNYEGWIGGRVAADQAQLGPDRHRLEGVAI
ncbi:MAG: DUF2786 domain-containing protein [Acidimicrobiales bacterium]